jgi:hypothetical protein
VRRFLHTALPDALVEEMVAASPAASANASAGSGAVASGPAAYVPPFVAHFLKRSVRFESLKRMELQLANACIWRLYETRQLRPSKWMLLFELMSNEYHFPRLIWNRRTHKELLVHLLKEVHDMTILSSASVSMNDPTLALTTVTDAESLNAAAEQQAPGAETAMLLDGFQVGFNHVTSRLLFSIISHITLYVFVPSLLVRFNHARYCQSLLALSFLCYQTLTLYLFVPYLALPGRFNRVKRSLYNLSFVLYPFLPG